MGSFSDAKRAAAAREDLPKLVGTEARVGLVLLDDDQREQAVIEGHVIRVDLDSLIFRCNGVDEEIPLAIISKRVQGATTVFYGERRRQ